MPTIFKVRVEVALRPGHSDPEGETIAEVLRDLEYPVKEVKVNKVYTIILQASSSEEAEHLADDISRRLLANPTKDTYMIKVDEQG